MVIYETRLGEAAYRGISGRSYPCQHMEEQHRVFADGTPLYISETTRENFFPLTAGDFYSVVKLTNRALKKRFQRGLQLGVWGIGKTESVEGDEQLNLCQLAIGGVTSTVLRAEYVNERGFEMRFALKVHGDSIVESWRQKESMIPYTDELLRFEHARKNEALMELMTHYRIRFPDVYFASPYFLAMELIDDYRRKRWELEVPEPRVETFLDQIRAHELVPTFLPLARAGYISGYDLNTLNFLYDKHGIPVWIDPFISRKNNPYGTC